MGRKPVVGLIGACLAGVTLAGCCDNNCTWPGGTKKDTQPPATNNSTAWNQPRQSQAATVAASGGNAGAGARPVVTPTGRGDAAAGGSNSLNANVRPPAEDYPSGRSMDSTAGGASGIKVAGYDGSDQGVGRTTAPTNTATNFNDPNAGGLPPVSGAPAAGGVPARPAPLGGLPPIAAPGGPALPRTDDITVVPGGKGAVVTPAPRIVTPPPPAGRDPGPTSEVLPPPVPPRPSSFGPESSAPAGELPPIPQPPQPPTTSGLQSPPLPPSAPPARGMGVPAQLQNQAVMQGGAPNQ